MGQMVTRSRWLLAPAAAASLLLSALVAAPAGAAPSCGEVSPLACGEVGVDLPLALQFDGSDGGLADGSGVGTGFTMVDPPSAPLRSPTVRAVPGYEPSLLDVGGGALTVTSTQGIQYRDPSSSAGTNSQVNGLGVGVDPTDGLVISTTVAPIDFSASPDPRYQQAGLWYGVDEDTYVKLAIIKVSDTSARVEMAVEYRAGALNDPSQRPDAVSTANFTYTARSAPHTLTLTIDPKTRTVTGSIDNGNGPTPVAGGTALPLPRTLTTPTTPGPYAGIFASHRHAAANAPITARFTQFTVTTTTPASTPTPPPPPPPSAPSGPINPFGHAFDRIEGVIGGVAVKGWAIDPDTPNPIKVQVSVEGTTTTLTADEPRPDVERAYPGYGDRHGFSGVVPASTGDVNICFTFLNVGPGTNTKAGCRGATVPPPPQAEESASPPDLTPPPAATNVGATKAPTSAPRTGAPTSDGLKVHTGNLVITEPGTVIDGWEIRGYVDIKADNVTIRNSVIEGGPRASAHRPLVASWWGHRNLLVEDSTLVAANPSVHTDGLSGAHFTARRLDISRVVDPIKVIGPNVLIEDCWLHDTFHSTNDPTQRDGVTHDDGIQIEGGSNIVVRGNVISDAHNAAIMITQNHSATSDLLIEDNVLSGGACQVNITEKPRGTALTGVTIRDNTFRPGSYGTTCPMRLPSSSPINESDNTWEADGSSARPVWF